MTHVEDPATLLRHVSDLAREADAATRTYDRTAWFRYAAIFVPIPFVVLFFKLQMQVWHYYVAGALFLAVALVMYAIDLAAVAKRDKAIEAVRRAQRGMHNMKGSFQMTKNNGKLLSAVEV